MSPVVAPSACRNRSTWGRNSGVIPWPLSLIELYAAVDLPRFLTYAAFRRELHGVDKQIPDYLLEAHSVSGDVTRLPIKRTRNMDPFSIGAGPQLQSRQRRSW